jgi:hypothetical protein
MAELKAGTRLKSAVCATQVMVISAPAGGDADVTCGGAAMIAMDAEPPAGAALDSAASAGTALGKRYVNEAGDLEILCTKPGEGSLALGGAALVLKEAKALPSSD